VLGRKTLKKGLNRRIDGAVALQRKSRGEIHDESPRRKAISVPTLLRKRRNKFRRGRSKNCPSRKKNTRKIKKPKTLRKMPKKSDCWLGETSDSRIKGGTGEGHPHKNRAGTQKMRAVQKPTESDARMGTPL